MQAGLLGKNFQRLRERLSGYRGGERFGSMGLGKRGRNVSKRKRRADGEHTQQRQHQGRDLSQ